MNLKEQMRLLGRGMVYGHWFNPLTQERIGHFSHHNLLSYRCADALAQLLAGRVEYAPTYMGFIYGSVAAPATMATVTRVQDWTSLGLELADVNKANIQLSPFTQAPSVTTDGVPYVDYEGNSTIFTSTSNTEGTYGFDGTEFADPLETGSYLYHAMLISQVPVGGTTAYWPIARVTLKQESGGFPQKPAGFELALTWQVSLF